MPQAKKTLRLILGDQLNANHSWFSKVDDSVVFLMAEMKQEQTYVKHHIQKIAGFFASMRNFAEALTKVGHQVEYIKITEKESGYGLDKLVQHFCEVHQVERFEYQMPDEWRLDQQLKALCARLKIQTSATDTEHFLSERDTLRKKYPGDKTPIMEFFYRDMRKKYGFLMLDEKTPEGGKWNFDKENRNKFNEKEPLPNFVELDNDVTAIVSEIKQAGIDYFGEIEEQDFIWPINRKQSLQILENFCLSALPLFGKYQDAMHTKHWLLYHSRLSFALNTKMISPQRVIQASIDAYQNSNGKIDLAQVEGFVRQILGWREYMRGIYWGWMPEFKEKNFLNHERNLPKWFWTGETKMNCLKHAIKQSLNRAYAHHIQRLMVTGNFALLAGIHPDEVDQWYLGIYIDAIEWVEITNTRGMSQFADGGIVGTKPYVSSSNYIKKMSNYCDSCHYNQAEKTGEKACPFNSLYWHFYERHREAFEKNPRIGLMYKTLDKMDAEQRKEMMLQAENYLSNIEKL
ncbi:MAG: cryptochrome/photolyase family protein [Luteibaculaceae bacterium]